MNNPFNFLKKVSKSINNSAANSIAKPIVAVSISSLENLTTPKKIQKKEPQKNKPTIFTKSNINQTTGDFYSRSKKTKGGKICKGGYKSIQEMENHC